MKSYVVFIFSMLFALLALVSGCENKKGKEEGVYYTCPMHPDIKKDQPGQCPICGMDLVKKEIKNHDHDDPNHKY